MESLVHGWEGNPWDTAKVTDFGGNQSMWIFQLQGVENVNGKPCYSHDAWTPGLREEALGLIDWMVRQRCLLGPEL